MKRTSAVVVFADSLDKQAGWSTILPVTPPEEGEYERYDRFRFNGGNFRATQTIARFVG
jgi:hypothetical protein